jgi:outer membrane protein OmpA-like peptidoglycan-associated protein
MNFSVSDRHFAQLHDFEAPADAEIIRLPPRLTEEEINILALSRSDPLGSTRDHIDWRLRISRFFAGRQSSTLANGKLEELRRFAVLVRLYGMPDDGSITRFLGAGYSPSHVCLIRQLLAQPDTDSASTDTSLIVWPLTALISGVTFVGMQMMLQDIFKSSVIAGAAFVFMAVIARPRSPHGKEIRSAADNPTDGEEAVDRLEPALARTLLLLASLIFVVGTALSLQSCMQKAPPEDVVIGSSSDIVTLADGATMVAEQGTRDRALADWLNGAGKTGQSITLRSPLFEQRSGQLTEQGIGDVATLATILKATPDARLLVVGRGDPRDSSAGAQLLGQMRSDTVANFLEARGISADQIRTGSGDDASAADTGQIRLVVWRGLTRREFKIASR